MDTTLWLWIWGIGTLLWLIAAGVWAAYYPQDDDFLMWEAFFALVWPVLLGCAVVACCGLAVLGLLMLPAMAARKWTRRLRGKGKVYTS